MKQGIIGKELISTGDQGKFRMTLEFDKTTSIEKNNFTSSEIENYILSQEEVASVSVMWVVREQELEVLV
jgi:HAE1 family hydrophobic/amphiphilic exporter-1